MIFWIGLYPAPFLRMMNGSVQALVQRLEHGATAASAPAGPEVRREARLEARGEGLEARGYGPE